MKLPDGAVYVGRPSRWGNPFTVEKYGRAHAIELYRQMLRAPGAGWMIEDLAALKPTALVCWCAPLPCHADVLAELLAMNAAKEATRD